MKSLKEQLLEICQLHVQKRIASYKDEIETIKDAIENNDKSNDEDDDSGNGKLFNDLEKNAQYLSDAHNMQDTLKLIQVKTSHQHVVLGSVVFTNSSTFFLAISLGKVPFEGTDYFIISKSSPIGSLLMNKTVGDTITFNGTSYTINQIT
ncbi:transcription elongation factor [Psychroserpens sp. BH13MA-6]